MASSIAPLHWLVQDDQNDVQLDFFSHLTLVALASESGDANGIVSGTINSRQLKQCSYNFFWSCDTTDGGVSVTVSSMASLHLLGLDD